jgi:hypothetical protein
VLPGGIEPAAAALPAVIATPLLTAAQRAVALDFLVPCA